MEIGKRKPYAILVFGAPMSGKTTFAHHFSESITAAFINLAQLQKEYHISQKLGLEFIRQLTKGKSTVIVEGMMDTEAQRNELRKLFESAGYQPILVWVQTDLNAIKQRMRKAYRSLDDAKAALADSYERIEAPSEDEHPLVISGKHTYQTQCRNVINRLSGN